MVSVMRVLAIDTSTISGLVGLIDGDQVIAECVGEAGVSHVEKLLPLIEQLLHRAGWKRVDGIVVGLGPGSFTGLRTGLAAAKGLALGWGIPLAGVSSLRALAERGRGAGIVVPMIDARRGELYGCAGVFSADGWFDAFIPERAASPELWGDLLAELASPLQLVGAGSLVYREQLENQLGQQVSFPHCEQLYPKALELAKLGRGSLASGGDDIAALTPSYIRESDAEMGFKNA